MDDTEKKMVIIKKLNFQILKYENHGLVKSKKYQPAKIRFLRGNTNNYNIYKN